MIWIIILSIISILCLFIAPAVAFSMLSQRKRILRTPVCPIGQIAWGTVAVRGKVVPLVPFRAPFSGRICGYCEFAAKEMHLTREGKVNQNSFDTVYEYTTKSPFYIQDSTGRLLVSPTNAHFDLVPDYRYDNYSIGVGKVTSRMLPDNIRESLDAAGVGYLSPDRGPMPMEFSETALPEGEEVYAIGYCSNNREEIDEALAGMETSAEPISYVLKNPSDPNGDKLYLTRGDEKSAAGSLLKFAVWMLLIAVPAGLITGLIAVLMCIDRWG